MRWKKCKEATQIANFLQVSSKISSDIPFSTVSTSATACCTALICERVGEWGEWGEGRGGGGERRGRVGEGRAGDGRVGEGVWGEGGGGEKEEDRGSSREGKGEGEGVREVIIPHCPWGRWSRVYS